MLRSILYLWLMMGLVAAQATGDPPSSQGDPASARGPAPSRVEGPAPSRVEGPAPSDVEGPAPSRVEGPVPSDVEGPVPSNVEGPAPSRVEGPAPSEGIPDYQPLQPPPEPSAPSYVSVMGKLFIALGIFVVLAYLAKRYLPGRMIQGKQGASLRLVQTLPLGGRKFVSLLEAEDERLVIGITDQSITFLHRLSPSRFERELRDADTDREVKTVSQMLEEES